MTALHADDKNADDGAIGRPVLRDVDDTKIVWGQAVGRVWATCMKRRKRLRDRVTDMGPVEAGLLGAAILRLAASPASWLLRRTTTGSEKAQPHLEQPLDIADVLLVHKEHDHVVA